MMSKQDVTIHGIARRPRLSSTSANEALREDPAIYKTTRARVRQSAFFIADMKKICLILFFILPYTVAQAEDGYNLWMRYTRVSDPALLRSYQESIPGFRVSGSSETMKIIGTELSTALAGLINLKLFKAGTGAAGAVLVGTPASNAVLRNKKIMDLLSTTGEEGFVILIQTINGKKSIIITGNTDIAVLYGTYHFLRLLQTEQPVDALKIVSVPRIKYRMLNHWDNLNRTVERGYAGSSIWNWHTLPDYLDPRYTDYARANASIGINGTVLTNVNANAISLTHPYLIKLKALADLFRPYGIRVFLTAKFSSPIELGGLKTADPLDKNVQHWWQEKLKEIYTLVPDFGGFVVKANSEGQPGPQDYHRTHAEGANMLADAIAPFKGVIIWRAFVYSQANPDDRHKQAYNDFVPLDGKFKPNVMVQVKNGAIDFMPREPFHPLFGAMPETPLMVEFQVTQEYLGQGTNLVFLAPLFKETLESDTYEKGSGSTVAKIVDGTLDNHVLSGMAGVANIGSDINWTGHPFGQANWYALGRLAWDHSLSSKQLADEWLRMTWSNDQGFLAKAMPLLLNSREVVVQYSNPIGLHHIMATGHHYGPAPWVNNLNRPDWNPVYYHKADSLGIGFNRTATGSNALAQYKPEARALWEDSSTCDERFLLWFHHLPWIFRMKSGRSLWDELCYQYYTGADRAAAMGQSWNELGKYVDQQRFSQVAMLLKIQHDEAVWWRDACLLYFQAYSRMPIPSGYEQPTKTLSDYQRLRFPFAPGN